MLAPLLREREGVAASRETVRRLLHRGDLVDRRPRPIPPPNEEQRRVKLAELRKLLEGRLRRYKKVHVICDDAGFHTSHEVIEYLWEHEGRIEVHLLPNYSPDYNPIERVWWHLHEDITRNHRCKDLGELLDRVFTWLERESPFEIEGSVYPKAKAGCSTFPFASFYLVTGAKSQVVSCDN